MRAGCRYAPVGAEGARHTTEGLGTAMRNLRDIEVTTIEIDSDGDGLSDEELVIVESTEGA